MNTFVFALLVASATAQWVAPGHWGASPVVGRWGVAAPWAAPSASQYHAQTELGEASYGYSYPGAAASNFRDAWGNQVGSYAYINPEGKHVKVSYVADQGGFRVLSNDLPVAPVAIPSVPLVGPAPVQETAEVVAAKVEHAKAHDEAKTRGKRQAVFLTPYNHPQFNADLVYSSVDLNQDGQPDKAVVPAPVVRTVVAPVVHSAPVVTSYAAALPYTHSLRTVVAAPVVAAPVVAKTVVNSLVLEKDLSAMTPADTNKLTEKIVSHEVLTPVAHSVAYATPYVNTWANPWIGSPIIGSPIIGSPIIGSPVMEKPVEDKPEKVEGDKAVVVESARKKRQVFAYNALPLEHPNYVNDFLSSSTDLNRDGMPDSHQVVAPLVTPVTYAYSGYPYAYSGYPYVY